MPKPEGAFPDLSLQHSTIRPIGVYALSGLATDGARLLSIDTVRGYLVSIDPHTNNTIILNPHQVPDWIGVSGLTVWEDTFWFAKGQEVLWCGGVASPQHHQIAPTIFTRLPYPVTGVAVCGEMVYVSCQKSGYIHVFDRAGKQLQQLPQPGVGCETMTIYKDDLWVCDRAEQTVYCLDRTDGSIQYSAQIGRAHV